MTSINLIFGAIAALLLFRFPRKWAALPLLIGASYATTDNVLEVGPFHFPLIRILIALGLLRVLSKGERPSGGANSLDKMLILWACWAVFSSFFHADIPAALVYRLGLAYNGLGLYFLLRCFITDFDSLLGLCKVILIVLVPVALEMVSETFTGQNLFSLLAGTAADCDVRDGKIRARGPFAHSILAGTVGAVCLPFAFVLWKSNRRLAIMGLLATCGMVISSRSSGPLMSCMFGVFGLVLWYQRHRIRAIRWTAFWVVLVLALVMKAPIYYLLARIDLTGSSTGYHRAILIDAAISHLGEWWFSGTDYTRHWTPNPGFGNDTDITNHYIRMGVWGGLPLMGLFIGILTVAFRAVGKAMRARANSSNQELFLIWALGSILFAHSASIMSVSYFDQSVFFLYLVLAAIGSLQTVWVQEGRPAAEPINTGEHERHLCHNC